MSNIITLIGPSGAGKTSFGKPLSKKIGYHFLDFDDDILEKIELKTAHNIFNILNIQKNNKRGISPINIVQNSVSSIKELLGDENFMKVEGYLLENLKIEENTILATSGSLPLAEGALEFLSENCTNIYLKKDNKEIKKNFSDMKLDRIVGMPSNINKLSKKEQERLYDEIMKSREEAYKKIANITYNPPKQFNIPKNKNGIKLIDNSNKSKNKKDIMLVGINKFFNFLKEQGIVKI